MQHRCGECKQFGVVESLKIDRHGQCRKLLIRNFTDRVRVDDPGDLVLGQGQSVAFGCDDVYGGVQGQSCRLCGPKAAGSSSERVTGPVAVAMDKVGGACSYNTWRQRPHGVM